LFFVCFCLLFLGRALLCKLLVLFVLCIAATQITKTGPGIIDNNYVSS
jgi:hypothetical protein